jgi:hypothetical protein
MSDVNSTSKRSYRLVSLKENFDHVLKSRRDNKNLRDNESAFAAKISHLTHGKPAAIATATKDAFMRHLTEIMRLEKYTLHRHEKTGVVEKIPDDVSLYTICSTESLVDGLASSGDKNHALHLEEGERVIGHSLFMVDLNREKHVAGITALTKDDMMILGAGLDLLTGASNGALARYEMERPAHPDKPFSIALESTIPANPFYKKFDFAPLQDADIPAKDQETRTSTADTQKNDGGHQLIPMSVDITSSDKWQPHDGGFYPGDEVRKIKARPAAPDRPSINDLVRQVQTWQSHVQAETSQTSETPPAPNAMQILLGVPNGLMPDREH